MGLALTRDGLPVRSWVFPGNTVDATTVTQVKDSLRGWKLGRSIFVGDAGMDSEANRQELAKGLGHYILAMPMGKLTEVREEVLGRAGGSGRCMSLWKSRRWWLAKVSADGAILCAATWWRPASAPAP